jgi:hypothetical protein
MAEEFGEHAEKRRHVEKGGEAKVHRRELVAGEEQCPAQAEYAMGMHAHKRRILAV